MVQAFHADLKEGWSLYRGMVYAKFFYGGMGLFFGRMTSPLNFEYWQLEKVLSGCRHLGVVDRWPATSKRARIAH